MAKRFVEVEDGNQAYLKRQKIKHATTNSAERIQSSRQLQQLLAFDQDAGRAKHGVQSFKTFLDGLGGEHASEGDQESRKAGLSLLKEYLISQLPKDEEDKTFTYLADIMQTWRFAAQSNNESLLSAVPAVLALLLKNISGSLEFTDFGLRLGRTLLQKQQLELLSRGMSSIKTKEYVISPSIRLLREVTTYDGGAMAKLVFRSREYTLKAFGRNLGLRSIGDAIETRRKPSVRTNAMRYLIALIKMLPVESKKELLSQRDITSALTRDISRDPPFLVADILATLKTHVIQDEQLPRDSKSKLFNATSLGRLVGLYGYDQQEDEGGESSKPIDVIAIAHEFLILACTAHEGGILFRQNGYYPRGFDSNAGSIIDTSQNFIDLGLDSLDRVDRFTDNVPVRNTTLSEFIQTLRPWSSLKQSELLLAIFKAAPELIAGYFYGKKSFAFDPKLTATWIGYSAFLFSCLRLPVPLYFGNPDGYGLIPPPTSIVMESILPQPLTQKALTRCMNQTSSLITFFAVRILIVSFEKLENILEGYREASRASALWKQAAIQLTEEFSRRCPSMKDVIGVLRGTGETDLMQRHAASRLLVLYYRVLPQIALEAKFDVSAFLTHALRLLKESDKGSEEAAMRVIEVEKLFQIAHCSPGMRWFHKPDSYPVSPFTAMIKLLVDATSEVPVPKIRSVLDSVARESGLLQSSTSPPALDALVWALKTASEDHDIGDICEFLDNCALRCSATPIKYINSLEIHSQAPADPHGSYQKPVSLLMLTIAEQWPFIAKSGDNTKIESIAVFIANYLAYSMRIAEDKKVLKALTKSIAAEAPKDGPSRKIIERARKITDTLHLPTTTEGDQTEDGASTNAAADISGWAKAESSMIEPSKVDFDDHKALSRWTTKEIAEVIEEDHAAALVRLLSSPHLSIRKEALTNIAKLASKLKESTYEEKEQIWLLLCEVLETAKTKSDGQPLPATITAFAASAISLLQDPLHVLYPKTNKLLSQGPSWETDKIPLLNSILNETPSLDDAYYQEIGWLLDYMVTALQGPEDMAIYHKRHVFEKLLSLYNNKYLAKGLRQQILRVLYRATSVKGGSATLITRFSIISWLQAQMKLDQEPATALKVLMERILQTCDEDRLKAWSRRSVEALKAE